MNNIENFEEFGFVKIDEFLDNQTISIISQYLENKIKRGEWKEESCEYDPTSKFSYYADPLIEILLLSSQKVIEEILGKELIPTYSYTRIYQSGESLKPHVDRPSCEISVTVNVATKGEPSPIYIQYKHNFPESFILTPGDAIIYKGCDVLHWRTPLKKDQLNVQFMLHYIDKNGPNISFAKDKRPEYGMSSEIRS